MGREPDDAAVERLLAERGQHLMRAAVALTGSRADGEDLLQAALEPGVTPGPRCCDAAASGTARPPAG